MNLAIDMGAESGRGIVGIPGDSIPTLHEVHRFHHAPVSVDGGLYWDMDALWNGVCTAIQHAVNWTQSHGLRLASLAVDTWGVDFGLLDKNGTLLHSPRCYRDPRNLRAFDRIRREWGEEFIYGRTGIQLMPINTLYQLASYRDSAPELLARAARLLFMPDLFVYRLTGIASNETTIASTSQLMDLHEDRWCAEFLDRLELPRTLVGDISLPGTVVGPLSAEVRRQTGAPPDLMVVRPASHDTASAVAAVPADADTRWCYLSSGTWSLLGAELDHPCATTDTRRAEFTNERGIASTIRFQKNMTGMWIIAECRRAWSAMGENWSYERLMAAAADATPNRTMLDPSRPEFVVPGDMPAKIASVAASQGQPVPRTAAETVRACLEGLARMYGRAIRDMESLLDRQFDILHVVGGGSRNELLNQLTADHAGMKVVAGPAEATALGNLMTQVCTLGGHSLTRHGKPSGECTAGLREYEPAG